jgi:DNA-binding transcriptional ArsR family regulator
MEAMTDVDLVFAALSDGTRRDILRRAMNGEEGVKDLAGHYPMSFAAVQKHIAVLERAGLITKHRSGRRKLIRTRMSAVREAQRLLDYYEELWRGRIERMEDIINEKEEM